MIGILLVFGLWGMKWMMSDVEFKSQYILIALISSLRSIDLIDNFRYCEIIIFSLKIVIPRTPEITMKTILHDNIIVIVLIAAGENFRTICKPEITMFPTNIISCLIRCWNFLKKQKNRLWEVLSAIKRLKFLRCIIFPQSSSKSVSET